MYGPLLTNTVCRLLLLLTTTAVVRSEDLADDGVNNNPQPYISVRTNVTCATTSECRRALGNNTWCGSGAACVKGQCYLLPDYPCARATRVCSERNRTCLPKVCTHSDECDDHLYCNGGEKCLRGRCTADARRRPPCGTGPDGTNNLCDETTRACLPSLSRGNQSLATLLAEMQRQQQQMNASGDYNKEDVAYKAQNGSWPHHNNNDSDNDDYWWVWVIVVIAVIILFVLIFLMVSVGSKSWTPVPVNNAQWQYSSSPV